MSRSKVKVTKDKNGDLSGYLGIRRTDLRQIHMEDMFGLLLVFIYPQFYFLSLHCTHVAFVNCLLKKLDDDGSSLGRVCRSRSISAACVRFMFGVVRCVR